MMYRIILVSMHTRYLLLFFFFFFSSRRRHTRFKCDWSSDVCSSDLLVEQFTHRWFLHRLITVFSRTRVQPRAPVGSATSDRKSVVVGKECRSRWSPYH